MSGSTGFVPFMAPAIVGVAPAIVGMRRRLHGTIGLLEGMGPGPSDLNRVHEQKNDHRNAHESGRSA
jgi:hypothetical protein